MTNKQMWSYGIFGAVILFTLLLSPLIVGINDGGHRVVIRHIGGDMETVFEPGMYMQNFGKVTDYKDVLTFDFDKIENSEGATIDQKGIAVQYQDGGMGIVYGIVRVRLPRDEAQMLKVHNEFRSGDGIAYKLIKPYVEGIINDTAGLLTSEESYAEKRAQFTQWIRDQLYNGKYLTKQKEIITVDAGYEYCLEEKLSDKDEKECRDVRKTTKTVPVIAYGDDGQVLRSDSDLRKYGLEISGFEIVDRTYERKTMDQISAKREATMAIITSKANAERARQDAITAEQQGLANVMKARYEKEVEKEKAIVDANREKEVATIKAQKLVELARQKKHEAEQKKLAAKEYKQEQVLRGEGDGAYKRLVMEADGALQQKLDAYVKINQMYADAVAKQKWVPEIQMGGISGTGQSNTATDLINLLMTKTARDLSLDMQVKK